MAFQSLYRRYRPQRFDEIRGQEHVVRALRNAVRDTTVAHAYLFSGPRGTGKTSTARVLAKALNCLAPVEGEPCRVCESCVAVEAGRSLDVIELDAASNNGVDAMRDLVARASLGTGGRAKVYIVDEVHMLSTAASNVLLKPLEEPPAHVTWVLATTDPQKVLRTIQSRTQHYEFRLLPNDTLTEYVEWIAGDAGLDVTPDAMAMAVRRGKGSARDTLSALDQIVAVGGEGDDDTSLDEMIEALCERDTGRALEAVAAASNAGRDPRQLAESLLAQLRDALLAVIAPDVLSLPDDTLSQVADQGRRLGPPAITRALDAIGQALLDMREAPDPRVSFEVALVRLTRPELDTSPAAMVERIERLERAARTGGAPSAPAAPVPAGGRTSRPELPEAAPAGGRTSPDAPTEAPSGPPAGAPSGGARQALGGVRRQAASRSAAEPPTAAPGSAPTEPPPRSEKPVPSAGGVPSRDEMTTAWGDHVMASLRIPIKAKFAGARFVEGDGTAAVAAFSTQTLVDLAESVRPDVEAAFATHFGRTVPMQFVVVAEGTPGGPPPPSDFDEPLDLTELSDAPPDNRTPIDHITNAFPGAELIEES